MLSLTISDLIAPVFVIKGNKCRQPLQIRPSAEAFSLDLAIDFVKKLYSQGIKNFLLFEVGAKRDRHGSFALSDSSILPKLILNLKKNLPDAYLIADLCLCQYTSHGECGIVINGELDNDSTTTILQKLALIYAENGVDAIMSSAMIDGIVGRLKQTLLTNGHQGIAVMSQSSKVDSAFYGPFRSCVQQHEISCNKASYQVASGSWRQSIREFEMDIEEGCDVCIIKPSIPYLDILYTLQNVGQIPIYAFCTSGEHALYFSDSADHSKERLVNFINVLERIKKAGAAKIISYASSQIAEMLRARNKMTCNFG